MSIEIDSMKAKTDQGEIFHKLLWRKESIAVAAGFRFVHN